eukprot:TRINITY_DN24499_c0_g1_i1.p1 TRINITY_DN24499_c0_g1~~TRINITY_DN24499_c0_g1_i1.p1  ORF type:complete len:121 (+),score=10.38 TRINITY_DN24499_c0_g1_i1:34-396(+)
MLRRIAWSRSCHQKVTNPKVIIDLCVVPMKESNGVSVSKEITVLEKLIRESGLKHKLHGYGTNIEGNWDEVFAVVKKCHLALHNDHGIPRLSTTIRCGTRIDKVASIEDKIKSVENKLAN